MSCNRQFVRMWRQEPIPVDATTHYQLTDHLVEQHWRPRAGWLPHRQSDRHDDRSSSLATIRARIAKHNGQLIVDDLSRPHL
jgi:hypothetical protein